MHFRAKLRPAIGKSSRPVVAEIGHLAWLKTTKPAAGCSPHTANNLINRGFAIEPFWYLSCIHKGC